MDNIKEEKNNGRLSRQVTLIPLIFYGLGNIIGAGIYALIGEISAISGYLMPLSFLAACIIVLFTALSYSELVSRYPLSAGVAVFIDKAFKNKRFSVLMGLFVAVNGLLFAATIIHGFNGYMGVFFNIPEYLSSFFILLILGSIAIWGINESVKAAVFLTVVEAIGLLIIIFAGLVYLPQSTVEYSLLLPGFDFSHYNIILLGAFLAFFAFTGFEDMVTIAEEVKEPQKTVPRAIVGSLVLATIIYMFVAFVSITTISPSQLAESSAPLADVYHQATGKGEEILGTIGVLAMINGALIQLIMVSRIFFGMSDQGWFPKVFKGIHPKTKTPVFATVFSTLIVYLFTLWLPILTLAELTSFFIFVIFTIVNIALIKIKLDNKTLPEEKKIFTVPLWVPALGVVLNILMLVLQFISIF